MKEKPIFGKHTRKVQPRLRMIANGSSKVNGIRAQYSGGIRLSESFKTRDKYAYPDALVPGSREVKKLKKGNLEKPVADVDSSVFVHFTQSSGGKNQRSDIHAHSPHSTVTGSRENMSTASVPLYELGNLANDDRISYIEMGEPLKRPQPLVHGTVAAPQKQLRKLDTTGGADVLIGIIDVGGFAFDHEDFLDSNGNTRFVRIWDQGGSSHPHPPSSDGMYAYGSEIKEAHMNQAIAQSPNVGLPPHVLEPQSQMNTGSHGTHVASIAAGNRGICRKARIVGVLIDIPDEESDRRRSFYDTTRIAHAISYIRDVAERIKREEGLEQLPVSINISLGTNGHAHDGSSALSRWVDSQLTEPGISVTVAAGNSGQEKSESEDDFGFVMGRIHSSGKLAAQGLDVDLEWQVVGNTVMDVSENEMEIWYSSSDRFSVSVKPPGEDWLEMVSPGSFLENKQLTDGSFLSIYNELYHPINGCNYIAIYLSPFLSNTNIVGVSPGLWKLRIHGDEVRDGSFHAWIERDDPYEFEPGGPVSLWHFPSFFSQSTNVDNTSVSSLACANNVISVANLDEHKNRINISSSQGPTRDGRYKPEVAAPGTGVVAANGFSTGSSEDWIGMSGTSMAAPYVAGVAGLMLHRNPYLTAAQIRGILQRTSRPLPGIDYRWQDDAGYGVIDPRKCLDESVQVYKREDLE